MVGGARQSARLVRLRKELKGLDLAERYVEGEKRKLIASKERVRAKIRKEKEILRLEGKIRKVRGS